MPITDFKPYSEKEFAEAFQKEVKNGDFRELLTWHTEEGIAVPPFYYEKKHAAHISGGRKDWNIIGEIEFTEAKTGNLLALQKLNEGVSALTFVSPVQSKADLSVLLNGIGIQYIEVNFKNSTAELVSWLADYCKEHKIDLTAIRGCFHLAETDAKLAGIFPNAPLLSVNAIRFHNAGGNITQQLSLAIAEGKALLEKLIHSGFTAEQAIKNISFSVAIGPDFFFEIAKLRALRVLWQNVTVQYLPNHSISLHIQAETSRIWMAKEDINNNLIRASFQSIAAVAGGADSVYVPPFDPTRKDGSRLSQNVQLVIKEEGFLDKVSDIGAGSYYIEEITSELAKNAWKKFQEIEKQGGFHSYSSSGKLAAELSESAFRLKTLIAEGKIKLIGVNKHRTDKSEKVFHPVKETNTDLHPIDLFH